MMISQYEKYIETPRATATQCMAGLVDLEYSDKQDECIQFDAWRDQDETFRMYSNALATMGRKPVIAEYEAASAWINGVDQRKARDEKEQKARTACKRMAHAV